FGDLSRYGLRPPPYGPVSGILRHGRIPLIDVGTIDRIKAGDIRVVGALEGFTRDGVSFRDGGALPFDLVVLATGYRTGLDQLLDEPTALLDARGCPRPDAEDLAPGLYFVGFHNTATGLLRQIRLEAPRIADAVVSRRSRPRSSATSSTTSTADRSSA